MSGSGGSPLERFLLKSLIEGVGGRRGRSSPEGSYLEIPAVAVGVVDVADIPHPASYPNLGTILNTVCVIFVFIS